MLRIVPYILIVAAFGYGLHANAETAADARAGRAQVEEQARASLVHTGRIVSVDGCNRDFNSITNLRGILIRGQKAVKIQEKKGILSEDQLRQATKFYRRALADNKLPDCRKATTIVSDKAGTSDPIPVPRYPGDRQGAR